MSPIRIGFVGLSSQGWASTNLASPLFEEPVASQYTLSAVCTTNPKSAAESAAHWTNVSGGKTHVRAYHSVDDIVKDPELDLIGVSVRASQHRDVVMKAIEAGKDVFVEWPAGKNLQQAEEMCEAAKKKRVRTFVGSQGHQSPATKKLKEIIDSGKIGKVMSTSTIIRVGPIGYWGPFIKKAVAGRGTFAEEGTSILEIAGGHLLEILLYIFGDFSSVTSTLVTQYPIAQVVDEDGKPTGESIEQENAMQVAFSGVLQNGIVVSVHIRAGFPESRSKKDHPFLWTVDGEEGTVTLEGDWPFPNIIQPMVYLNGDEIKMNLAEGTSVKNIGRAYEEYAKNGDYTTLEDAVKVRRVIDAILRSAAEGRRIDLI
ncbi:dimeric dihydrodiol [Moniliophthora roreri MCA 2997]|uniref:Dimeric dihydrodiol n=1 Tax=Moniliophthora roreri (strain MCA 2997) TaxID=1381753 RepID=V2XM26_MONRO|nr:dimeric dihydrodiol [Moniliophthora roreri MCA 2997]